MRTITSDAHAGLKGASDARLAGAPWQRRRFHLVKSALAYVPRPPMQAEVVAGIRAALDAPDRGEAERRLDQAVKEYRAKAPRLAEWSERDVPESVTVFSLPARRRRRLRTSNVLERLNGEINRRTRVSGLFPNEASSLRLVGAVVTEVSEEWETGRRYLTVGPG